MPKNWCEFLSPSDTQAIHDTSMKLMGEIGILFPEENALEIFKNNGFKVEGKKVFFSEEQVMGAVKNVPRLFTVHARNPERDITVGDGSPIFAPGYGAPFLVDAQEGKRDPTLEDYHNLVKLAHVLPNQDLSGHLMVEPRDIPSETAHLQMLLVHMLHSDKAFIGSSEGGRGSQHTVDMIEILFGGKPDRPVTLGLINPISPLGYGTEMLEAILAYANAKQPLIFASLIMAGSTGPITLAGVLAVQNAELLAGIVLAQLVNPGLPCLYGATSTNIDLRTGALAVGSPELSLCLSAHAQLARFYGLPSRGGGALTDASLNDAQAGYESMFSMLTTVNSGIDFVLHSGGIVSSYLAFSYEKFVMDDEVCGMMRQYLRGIQVDAETLAYDVIANVGSGGHFLGEDHTLERCRTEFWQPVLFDRSGLEAWWDGERLDTTARATQRWKDLLASHEDPPLDETTARQLQSYVEKHLE
ncbi:MAG: trimethylamine methyltransferase family protein [Anaerolineales bacterium]